MPWIVELEIKKENIASCSPSRIESASEHVLIHSKSINRRVDSSGALDGAMLFRHFS